MDTFEKSKLLAEITGRIVYSQNIPGIQTDDGVKHFPIPDLYQAENMPVAWEIINRVSTIPHGANRVKIAAMFDIWWKEAELYACKSIFALQLALDKLLELALDAGLPANIRMNTDKKGGSQN